MGTSVVAYAQTHSIVFLSDNLRNTLRELIRENSLNPEKLMQDWDTVERGIRTWVQSGHLKSVVIEFYRPGASEASARWDVPIGYFGSGSDEDMWRDKNYLKQLIAKSRRPTADCTYRVVLSVHPGSPDVDGFSGCALLSTGNMSARHAGTVISTGHLTAGITYWK